MYSRYYFVFFVIFCIFYSQNLKCAYPSIFDKLDLSFIEDFSPGKKVNFDIAPFKDSTLIHNSKKSKIFTYSTRVPPFIFHIFFQTKDNIIQDSLTSTPGQIIFDPFLSKVIEKIPFKFEYFTVENHSFHLWSLDSKFVLLSSSCTLTCFPIYITQIIKNRDTKIKTIFESLLSNPPKFIFKEEKAK